jgi:hypothetical protein
MHVWKDRWQSLDRTLGDLNETLVGVVKRQGTLQVMIDGLRNVGKQQFDYFHDHFFGQEEPRFERYPPEAGAMVELSADYAMRQVLDRIAYDADAILAAIQQRSAPPVQGDLELTDRLVFEALALARLNGLLADEAGDGTSAMTYFSDAISTRVIPYATVAFLGVPLSSRHVPEDLLAIPHEVGHYVYWNGRDDEGRRPVDHLREDLGCAPGSEEVWTCGWLEELFADVYGCLVAGPVIALDFQDLLLQPARENFEQARANDIHPTPILRPFIYTYVLRKARFADVTRKTLDALADKLDRRWWTKLEERGYQGIPIQALPASAGLLVKSGAPDPIAFPPQLSDTINAILALFDQDKSQVWPAGSSTLNAAYESVATSPELADLEDLYTVFKAQQLVVPETAPHIPDGSTTNRLPHLNLGRDQIPDRNWIPALRAGGWSTGGTHTHM